MTEFGPGSTLGILGSGQLGRMLASAAARLGIRCVVLGPDDDPPAAALAPHIRCAYDDPDGLARLVELADVVTFEFENVDADVARSLAARVPVRPGPRALEVSQDRWVEKSALVEWGLPVGDFWLASAPGDIAAAVERAGKVVVKTRRFGYDGKGQVVVDDPAQASAAWSSLAGAPAIIEAWVPFAAEVSVVMARGLTGECVAYDLVGNSHREGILRRSRVPAGQPAAVEERCLSIARTVAEALDYHGVLAVEMFVLADGEVLVNEMAPRVHNSGHWTLDACVVSQFEQHVRAVMGWPLVPPTRHSDAEMHNLIGDEADDWRALAAREGTAIHLYGKAEARPGRKMGHLTRVTPRSR